MTMQPDDRIRDTHRDGRGRSRANRATQLASSILLGLLALGLLAAGADASSAPSISSESAAGVTSKRTGATQSFEALPAPVIASESVSRVTGSDATLEAGIDPEGQNVRYQFQLVADPHEYASELECPEPSASAIICIGDHVKGALPIGFISGNLANPLADQPVSLDLAGAGVELEPNTTYHYRVIAAPSVLSEDTIEWEGPPVYGADQTFTTTAGPVIESESLSHLTSKDATLEAEIDTEGLETEYEFRLVTAPTCLEMQPPCERPQELFPLPSGKLLGSLVGQSVSVDLNSAGVQLSPGERYEYLVRATGAGVTVTGVSHAFTAREESTQPPNDTEGSGGTLRTSLTSQQNLRSASSRTASDLTRGRRRHSRHRRKHHKHHKHHDRLRATGVRHRSRNR